MRDQTDAIRAFHNTCRHRPHTLLAARAGTIDGTIACTVHDLHYGYDGRLLRGETPGDLLALELVQQAGLILVRPADGARAAAQPRVPGAAGRACMGCILAGSARSRWLRTGSSSSSSGSSRPSRSSRGGCWGLWCSRRCCSSRLRPMRSNGRRACVGTAPGWSADHYVRLAQRSGAAVWQRLFMPPNQLIEIRPEGALLLQVLPDAPGRCRIRRIDLCAAHGTRIGRAMNFLSQRLIRRWLEQDVALAASIQSGLQTMAEEAHRGRAGAAGVGLVPPVSLQPDLGRMSAALRPWTRCADGGSAGGAQGSRRSAPARARGAPRGCARAESHENSTCSVRAARADRARSCSRRGRAAPYGREIHPRAAPDG